MKIRELKGRIQVFTLKDGTTFRILAHGTSTVPEKNISNEMRIAESMGIILITKDESLVVEETNKNKKSGGTK